MPSMTTLLALLPIVAFVVVDAFAGLKAGIRTAMLLAVMVFAADWYLVGHFEPSSLIEPLFIIALGATSLRSDNPRFFRFQPVATGVVMALMLAYFQIFSTPFLEKTLPPVAKALEGQVPDEMLEQFFAIWTPERLGRVSHHLIYVLLGHAGLVAWTALRCGNWWWLAARLAIYPLTLGLMLFEMRI